MTNRGKITFIYLRTPAVGVSCARPAADDRNLMSLAFSYDVDALRERGRGRERGRKGKGKESGRKGVGKRKREEERERRKRERWRGERKREE